MPKTSQSKRTKQSIEAQLALAERALKSANKNIAEQMDRACDLEVERALTLYRAGKATLHDAEEIMQEARRRVG